jgi:hypothetical protein
MAAAEFALLEDKLRPGLWQTINERYPGSMITKSAFVPPRRDSQRR